MCSRWKQLHCRHVDELRIALVTNVVSLDPALLLKLCCLRLISSIARLGQHLGQLLLRDKVLEVQHKCFGAITAQTWVEDERSQDNLVRKRQTWPQVETVGQGLCCRCSLRGGTLQMRCFPL